MVFVEWDESLELGDESIDRQHRTLFDLVNRLAEAVDAGEGPDMVEEAVDIMSRYCLEHFMDEEAAMASAGYPGLGAHKAMHRSFMVKTAQLADESEFGGVLAQDLLDYLKRWLLGHITSEDVRFVLFVRESRKAAQGQG